MKTGPKPRPASERFWAKVARGAPEECWPWTGGIDARGQGSFGLARGRTVRAHRFAYEDAVGPIPEGLTIDHLCCNKICCNPTHLEPVTTQVNTRRWADGITHCPKGHAYDEVNTRYNRSGWRECRTCRNEQRKAYGGYHKARSL